MTTKTFNAETELNKLISEMESKKQQVLLKESILNMGNFDSDNLIVYSDKSIGFGWRKPLDKNQVKEIFAKFPINGGNYEMKFASSEQNFLTDSSLIVRWENSHTYRHNKVFKIHYESNGLHISIEVPCTHFGSHVWYQPFQGNHKGFGRYEMFNDMFIDYFYTQSYSGGYNTLYFLEGAETLQEYENFVITGEFKYQDDIS